MERIPAEAWRPREIGELNFQERVLEEALRLDYPVLERCRFLGIAAAQMDEFWAVRAPSIAGHKHIRRWRRAAEKCDRLFSRMEEGWLQLQPLLQRAGILLCEWAELSYAEQEQMLELYQREWEPSMRRLPVDRTEDWPGGTVCFLVRKGIHAAAEIVSFSYGSSALMSLPGTVGCRFLSRHELCRRGLQAQGWRVEGAFRPVREAKGLLLRPGGRGASSCADSWTHLSRNRRYGDNDMGKRGAVLSAERTGVCVGNNGSVGSGDLRTTVGMGCAVSSPVSRLQANSRLARMGRSLCRD